MKEFKTQRKEWERERKEMRRNMMELKNRMETLEQKGSQERQKWGEGEGKNMMDKIKRIEKSMEDREREKRRRNIMMKEMEIKEGKRKKAVEEIL